MRVDEAGTDQRVARLDLAVKRLSPVAPNEDDSIVLHDDRTVLDQLVSPRSRIVPDDPAAPNPGPHHRPPPSPSIGSCRHPAVCLDTVDRCRPGAHGITSLWAERMAHRA